jgi:hypothetical protein
MAQITGDRRGDDHGHCALNVDGVRRQDDDRLGLDGVEPRGSSAMASRVSPPGPSPSTTAWVASGAIAA